MGPGQNARLSHVHLSPPYFLGDYFPPTPVAMHCQRCETRLGSQDPGWLCGMCKFIQSTWRSQ